MPGPAALRTVSKLLRKGKSAAPRHPNPFASHLDDASYAEKPAPRILAEEKVPESTSEVIPVDLKLPLPGKVTRERVSKDFMDAAFKPDAGSKFSYMANKLALGNAFKSLSSKEASRLFNSLLERTRAMPALNPEISPQHARHVQDDIYAQYFVNRKARPFEIRIEKEFGLRYRTTSSETDMSVKGLEDALEGLHEFTGLPKGGLGFNNRITIYTDMKLGGPRGIFAPADATRHGFIGHLVDMTGDGGSVIHEWTHGLDRFLQWYLDGLRYGFTKRPGGGLTVAMEGRPPTDVTDQLSPFFLSASDPNGLRPGVFEAWQNVRKLIKGSNFEKQAIELDAIRMEDGLGPYWNTSFEKTARAVDAAYLREFGGETALIEKSYEMGVPVHSRLFPVGKELDDMTKAFKDLFKELGDSQGAVHPFKGHEGELLFPATGMIPVGMIAELTPDQRDEGLIAQREADGK